MGGASDGEGATKTVTATVSSSTTERSVNLSEIAVDCEVEDWLGDGGESLSIRLEGLPDEEYGEYCVLEAVDLPDYIVEQLDNTAPIDGTQQAEWDDMMVQWSVDSITAYITFVEK